MSSFLDYIEKLYTENIQKMGVSSQSVGWNTESCQYLRFEKLANVIYPKTDEITVNDLGCGYGEMAKYFVREGFHLKKYTGVDISNEMITNAATYLKDFKETQVFLHREGRLCEEADYSFASGIFNVRCSVSEEVWLDYIQETLCNLNQYSIKGFAFNLLSTYVDFRRDHLYYGDPCYFFHFCKEHFSKKVTLLHDYPLWEWTIFVKKE